MTLITLFENSKPERRITRQNTSKQSRAKIISKKRDMDREREKMTLRPNKHAKGFTYEDLTDFEIYVTLRRENRDMKNISKNKIKNKSTRKLVANFLISSLLPQFLCECDLQV